MSWSRRGLRGRISAWRRRRRSVDAVVTEAAIVTDDVTDEDALVDEEADSAPLELMIAVPSLGGAAPVREAQVEVAPTTSPPPPSPPPLAVQSTENELSRPTGAGQGGEDGVAGEATVTGTTSGSVNVSVSVSGGKDPVGADLPGSVTTSTGDRAGAGAAVASQSVVVSSASSEPPLVTTSAEEPPTENTKSEGSGEVTSSLENLRTGVTSRSSPAAGVIDQAVAQTLDQAPTAAAAASAAAMECSGAYQKSALADEVTSRAAGVEDPPPRGQTKASPSLLVGGSLSWNAIVDAVADDARAGAKETGVGGDNDGGGGRNGALDAGAKGPAVAVAAVEVPEAGLVSAVSVASVDGAAAVPDVNSTASATTPAATAATAASATTTSKQEDRRSLDAPAALRSTAAKAVERFPVTEAAASAATAAVARDKVDLGAVPAPSSSAISGGSALGNAVPLPSATSGDAAANVSFAEGGVASQDSAKLSTRDDAATEVNSAEGSVASKDNANLSTRETVAPEQPLVPPELVPAKPLGRSGNASATVPAADGPEGSSLWGTMNPAAEFLKGWVENVVPQKKRELKREKASICWEQQW